MTKMTGRILDPKSPGWDKARRDFCSRINCDERFPRAVVFCQNRTDIVNAIQWARENGVHFRARSGRHSYEAYSVAADGLVIDVSEMDEISVYLDSRVARCLFAIAAVSRPVERSGNSRNQRRTNTVLLTGPALRRFLRVYLDDLST